MFGFYRIATAVPGMQVADVRFNTEQIIDLIKQGIRNNVSVILFPELTLTGYTCGDLFFQSHLLEQSENAFEEIMSDPPTFDFSVKKIFSHRLPDDWNEQRKFLGLSEKDYAK